MNSTTVTTMDTLNEVTYTTTDKLYALAADGSGSTTIKAGSNNQTVLAMSKYWGNSREVGFWLRSPGAGKGDALYAIPGDSVGIKSVINKNEPQPASNLNLSKVLFASAATAVSSDTAESGTIAGGTAMTLRLDGSGKSIGAAFYHAGAETIEVRRGNTEQTVALVVQGRGNVAGVEQDWYYSKRIDASQTVSASEIESALSSSSDIDLSVCKIWLEITKDNVTYAVNAEETESIGMSSVAITGIDAPIADTALDTKAACETTGVGSTTPPVTWTPNDSTAGYNTSYTASITLTADTFYDFTNPITATVNGNAATSVRKNSDRTLTVTYEFNATAKRKINSVTVPKIPTNNTFTTYYGYDGYDASPISGSNSELGTQATVTFEGTMVPTTADVDVTWTIANDNGAGYDRTPGAMNTFRWTIPASALTNYNGTVCQGYDAATGTITGTVTITNKAATPVVITGTDSGISYTGSAIDVSRYITIDSHPDTVTYSLITGTDGGTGKGELSGTTLTVTKTGTFKIKVEAAAKDIYAAGEKIITLTVDNGTIEYTATDYSGTYDGQAHSINVNVTNPEGTTITYSTDGINYGSDNPSFTDAGTYTVYYQITKENYDTATGSKTVTINKKSAIITAENQDIVWGNDIDRNKYTKDGLVKGDSITEITLTPSTTALTENGTISISGVKIENATGEDVTGNYDITSVGGTLKIAHDTSLAPERIEAVKTKTSYTAGESLNVDDITVTAYYTDGYSRKVTGFTTNVTTIDMSKSGDRTLTVSYTENGETKTKDIIVTVKAATPQPPKKGAVVADEKGTGDYKVTDVAKKEVTYQTPANKKLATISVPATVKIGGVTYKVTSIADNAFANNKKITKVTIGSNVTTIGKKAFYKCTSLKKITIPSKVKKIGKQAFYGCKKLKTITIKTTKLTGKNVGSSAFKGIYAKATIKVPKKKLKSYKKLLKARGVGKKAKIKKYL